MSGVDVGTAFVTVLPTPGVFQAALIAQVNAAVVKAQAQITPLVVGAATASNARTGQAAAAATTQTTALANAATLAAGATSTQARAALAVTKALDAEAVANARLASAIAAGTNQQRIQTLTTRAAIATESVRISQLRVQEAAVVSSTANANAARGALVGLSRITPGVVLGLQGIGVAAIVAGLAIKSAVTSAADFEEQINTFAAVTGASADEIRRVQQAAQDLGADLSLPATSAGDAAVAMTELAKAGLSVNDTLDASRGVLQLATAANIDVGSAAQIAATQLNAFQLAGDQATRVAELLADASIAAQGEITDFAAGFQQVSAVANQVGLSIENTTGLLTQLGLAGLKGADGGTSLRTALLRLVPTTKEAKLFQDALGISIDKTLSIGEQIVPLIEQYRTALADLTPVQQQQTLTQIFGQDAIRAASIIFSQQEGELRRLTAAFEDQNSIQDLTEAKAKGLKGQFRGLQSQTETLGLKLGDLVDGPLTELTGELANIVSGANEAADAMAAFFSKIGSIEVPDFLREDQGDTLGDSLERIAKRAAFFLPKTGKEVVNQIKKARATVREEIARQARLDALADGGQFGITTLPPDPGPAPNAVRNGPTPVLTESAKRRRAAIEEATRAKAESDKALEGILVPLKLRQAVIDAQIRGSLQAELVADNKIVAFFKAKLSRLKKGTEAFLVVSGQLQSAQSQRDAVLGEIASNEDRAAAEQEARRRDAAAEATRRANEAIENERQRQAAQEQLRQTILDIQLQSSDNRISRASGTTRTSDEKREFNIRIKILDTERDRFAAIARAAKKGSQKALDATLEVKRLDGQIIAIRTQIKNLGKSTGGGDSGGFTLSQLFQEAADQFNTFGSNIAGRNGVLSGQDARGALGQTVKALNPTLPVLDATLSESEKQTAYLATIAAMISRGATTVPAPITGNRGRIGSLTAIDATKAAAVFGY